jgi:hypothetical protein
MSVQLAPEEFRVAPEEVSAKDMWDYRLPRIDPNSETGQDQLNLMFGYYRDLKHFSLRGKEPQNAKPVLVDALSEVEPYGISRGPPW